MQKKRESLRSTRQNLNTKLRSFTVRGPTGARAASQVGTAQQVLNWLELRGSREKPNEDGELLRQFRTANPKHNAATWIYEALLLNNNHCSDDAVAISNLLYLALESLKDTKPHTC